MFYGILESKNNFLFDKKKKVQKVEKLTFFQRGLSTVLVKNGLMLTYFFFRQYRPGKCVLLFSRTKKQLFRL